MSRFTAELDVRNELTGRVHSWTLLEPMAYYLDDPDGPTVIVPTGFETDYASVPRLLWWWIAPWGRHGRAAVLHDHLYAGGVVHHDPHGGPGYRPTRLGADRIFRDAMGVLDRKIFGQHDLWGRSATLTRLRTAWAAPKRWAMWSAVALFGHWAYRRHRTQAPPDPPAPVR